MKLTHIYTKMAVCILSAVSFAACDNIDEDDRYIYVEPVPVARNIIVEDFTGQHCVGCPNGSAVLEQLTEQYTPETVIVVGMHSGTFSVTSSGHTPLWTSDAEYYYSQWPISVQPTAVIDRGSYTENYDTWPTLVSNALGITAPLTLEASSSYDESSRTVSVAIVAKGQLDVSGKLQLWLTEDNIVSFQLTQSGRGSKYDYNYVHNHVFRAAVNGRDGEDFTLGWDEEKTLEYTISLNELEDKYIKEHEDEGSEYVRWKPEDMYVVAFVYNNDGVQQAVRVPVIDTRTGDEVSDVAE